MLLSWAELGRLHTCPPHLTVLPYFLKLSLTLWQWELWIQSAYIKLVTTLCQCIISRLSCKFLQKKCVIERTTLGSFLQYCVYFYDRRGRTMAGKWTYFLWGWYTLNSFGELLLVMKELRWVFHKHCVSSVKLDKWLVTSMLSCFVVSETMTINIYSPTIYSIL